MRKIAFLIILACTMIITPIAFTQSNTIVVEPILGIKLNTAQFTKSSETENEMQYRMILLQNSKFLDRRWDEITVYTQKDGTTIRIIYDKNNLSDAQYEDYILMFRDYLNSSVYTERRRFSPFGLEMIGYLKPNSDEGIILILTNDSISISFNVAARKVVHDFGG
ncbi:MAG: hypothetical protein LBO04_02915 [Spirochaetaceae bacterium]|nr:hypothetical protein [Spirochaetaceae bacterium]